MEQKDLPFVKAIGICVKDRSGKVISQNEKCLDLCGNKIGKVCRDGCMSRYLLSTKTPPFDSGAFFLKSVNIFGVIADVFLINDSKFITSVLYEGGSVLKEQLKYLKQFDLTKSELEIIGRVLAGSENQKIASELFISKGTLRSHLNNIYRKVPAAIREQLLFIHKNKKM